MATYDDGIIKNISGSLGGVEFVHTGKVDYIRMKANPTNKWTPARERARHRMSKASRAWGLLTYEQSKAWSDFGLLIHKTIKSGKIIPYTNRDIFIKVNSNLLEINQSIILSPPEKVYPVEFDSINAEILSSDGNDDIKLFFNPQIPAETKVIVYGTFPLKPGRFKVKPCWYKKFAVLDSCFVSGSSVINEYKDIFPVLSLKSARIGLLFRPVSSVSGLDLTPFEIQIANIQPVI